MSDIADNLRRVRERIEQAARRVGRNAADIELCAVTKGVGLARIREAVEAGCEVLGENRVQEAEPKIREGGDIAAQVSWHMIGHLQSNKARRAVVLFDAIDSIDSLALARRVSTLGQEAGRRVPVLIEVLTEEGGSKKGFSSAEVGEAVAEIRELEGLEVRGLMTMAPFTSDEKRVRASFAALREMRERIDAEGLVELSMGMSRDFEIAIEEGSTMVRIGTAIFG